MHLIVPESFEKYCYSSPTPEVMNQNLQEAVGSRGVEPSYACFSKAAQVILTRFPSGNISCYPSPRIVSPKIHVLLSLSVGGAHSTCQCPCLAGMNPKSFKVARSGSKVPQSLSPHLFWKQTAELIFISNMLVGQSGGGGGRQRSAIPLFIPQMQLLFRRVQACPLFTIKSEISKQKRVESKW